MLWLLQLADLEVTVAEEEGEAGGEGEVGEDAAEVVVEVEEAEQNREDPTQRETSVITSPNMVSVSTVTNASIRTASLTHEAKPQRS